MPIKIPDKLPATAQLRKENIFVMSEKKAMHQDIRPLKIVIVNLMPTKIATETQLLRLLSNSPLQIEIDFLQMDTHESKNTPSEHLATFYTTFDEIKDSKYDGMIITGAPVENLEYEDVDYWGELTRIMDWSKTHVTSTLHICWAALAGLYYHYGVPKHPLKEKCSGVFKHKVNRRTAKLVRGFDNEFYAPHSRFQEVRAEDIKKVKELEILCDSKEAALSETGDLLIPIAEGIITEEDVLGSLGDVINGKIKGRENDEEIIVYETVGVAAQDLVAAKVIYDKAVEAGKGLRWGE